MNLFLDFLETSIIPVLVFLLAFISGCWMWLRGQDKYKPKLQYSGLFILMVSAIAIIATTIYNAIN